MLTTLARAGSAISAALLLTAALTGCGDFFNKNTSTGGGGGGATGAASYVYVGTQTGVLASFALSASGAFTQLADSPSNLSTSSINSLVVTPGNGYLYAAVAGAGTYGLGINSTTGVPSLVSKSALATDVIPVALTIDPTGKWLLAAGVGSGLSSGSLAVGIYTINSDGTLSPLQGSPVSISLPSGTNPANLSIQNITVAPDSSFVFVSMGSLGVAPLPFNTSGGLSQNTSVITPKTTSGATNQDLGLAVDPTSKFLYVGETNQGIRAFSIAANFPEVSGSPFKAGGQPRFLLFDGTGANLYAANQADGTISASSVAATGVLTEIAGSPFSSVGSQPYALALDQTKKYLLGVNIGGNPSVQAYGFSTTTAGALAAGSNISGLSAADAIAATH